MPIAYYAVSIFKIIISMNLNNNKKELVDCVKGLYCMGLTTSVSGNHSIRFRNKK